MNKNEVSVSQMLNLNYSVSHGNRNVRRELQKFSNKGNFERFIKLCLAKYYFRIYPYKHQVTGEIYLWIFAVKAKSQSFDFKLKLNADILNVIMGYIATGELADIATITPDDLDTFNQQVSNFSLQLFQAEVAKGQKKIRHVSNKTYSKYDYGMIIYDTENNNELRDFIDSTII
jgi:hypothetical protein